jgi:hypothetical protein
MPASSWTIVMTCGVVSIDLATVHQALLSAILFWFTAAVWIFLTGALALPMILRDASSPVVMTIVAATGVLGSRLVVDGHRTLAAFLLVMAAIEWLVLSPEVLRRWATPTKGISFVLAVATFSVALLSDSLADAYHSRWLCGAGLVLVLAGLVLYGFVATRFDLSQLLSGPGDHWVAGGALAIAALSAATGTKSAEELNLFTHEHRILVIVTFVVWSAAMIWLLILFAGEVIRPRLSVGLPRWATGFPLGMYAACSFAVGNLLGSTAIVDFAKIWTWVAFAATLALLAGLLTRTVALRRPVAPRLH